MRIRLSYTVEEDEVFDESAKLLGLLAPNVQRVIDLFKEIQAELSSGREGSAVNLHKCYKMVDELRDALLNMDTRLSEIRQILQAFDELKRNGPEDPALAEQWAELQDEVFGAD